MKSIKQILNETELNEDWQYGVDFSTGDTIKYWVSQEAKEHPKTAIEWLEEDLDEYYKRVEIESKLQNQYDKIEDKRSNLIMEIWNKKKELRDLRIDMEEELGHLYSSGNGGEAEKRAQYYGEEMNKIEQEMISLQAGIENCENKMEELSKKISDVWK